MRAELDVGRDRLLDPLRTVGYYSQLASLDTFCGVVGYANRLGELEFNRGGKRTERRSRVSAFQVALAGTRRAAPPLAWALDEGTRRRGRPLKRARSEWASFSLCLYRGPTARPTQPSDSSTQGQGLRNWRSGHGSPS